MSQAGALARERRPLHFTAEAACYATGFFSLGLVPMMSLAVPLWAVTLGASPFVIGLAVGARSVLPLVLSIHGGVVMDRLGVRRVLFWLAGACILLAPLYPAVPTVPALIVLQLLFGLAQGLSWIGAQTQVGLLTKGSPTHTGRFSFASTAGTFLGPLAVGLAWDLLGPSGAFLGIALWCAALWLAIYFLPRPAADEARPARLRSWSELVPRLVDYRDALRLVAVPAVAFVVVATFSRIAAISIQGSFYTVYLESIDLSGAAIGALIATASIIASLSALFAGVLARRVPQTWVLIFSIALATAAMTATPFVAGLAQLGLLAALFGVGIGLTLPPILSILSQSVGSGRQGMSVGLRTTANRLASLVIPVIMGAAAHVFGLSGAFIVIGGALALVLAAMGWMIVRGRL